MSTNEEVRFLSSAKILRIIKVLMHQDVKILYKDNDEREALKGSS